MNEPIESLRQHLAAAATPAERALWLNRLAYALHHTDPTEARNLAKQALTLSAREGDKRGEAESYRVIGNCWNVMGNYARAEINFQRSERLLRHVASPEGLSATLLGLGLTCYFTGEYVRSLEYLQESLELAERAGELRTIMLARNAVGSTYRQLTDYPRALQEFHQSLAMAEQLGSETELPMGNIAIIYYMQEEYEKSLEMMVQVLELLRASGDRRNEAACLGNLASLHHHLNDTETSIQHWNQAMLLHQELGNDGGIAFTLRAIGELHEMEQDYPRAVECYQRSEALARQIHATPHLVATLNKLGVLWHTLGEHQQALAVLQEAETIATTIGDSYFAMSACESIAETLEATGDVSEALHYYRKYHALFMEVEGHEKQRQIANVEIRAAIEAANRERELLRLRAETLEREMELKNRELTSLAMQLVQKNEFLETLSHQMRDLQSTQSGAGSNVGNIIRQVEATRNQSNDWELFEAQFRSTHQGFIERLLARAPMLSPAELKVCAMMKINLSTKEIANILCCSARTVEHHRYKVRSKLELEVADNLGTFLAGL
ncbi:MAG: tetratricopeptide repeat protein [Armatimonadetes bacterium]|nr:tetratricopeptide repeat protein [Armatimonadota bacterium]